MKKTHHALLIVSVFVLSLAAAAETPDSLKVNVPFDFSVGKKVLPAGTYSVDRVWSDNLDVLRIHAVDKKADAVILGAVDETQAGPAALRFNRYDDQFFLSEVRTASGLRKLPLTRLEQTLQRAAKQESSLTIASQ